MLRQVQPQVQRDATTIKKLLNLDYCGGKFISVRLFKPWFAEFLL